MARDVSREARAPPVASMAARGHRPASNARVERRGLFRTPEPGTACRRGRPARTCARACAAGVRDRGPPSSRTRRRAARPALGRAGRPAAGPRPLRGQGAPEVRGRVRAREVVGDLVVDGVLPLERERVEAALPTVQGEAVALGHDPVLAVGRRGGVERNGVHGPVAAEADVGEVRALGEVDAQHHVRARPHVAGPRAHARAERRDREAERARARPRTACSARSSSRRGARRRACAWSEPSVEPDLPPEQDVEVLERDRPDVGLVQRAKRVERRPAGVRGAGAAEVGARGPGRPCRRL